MPVRSVKHRARFRASVQRVSDPTAVTFLNGRKSDIFIWWTHDMRALLLGGAALSHSRYVTPLGSWSAVSRSTQARMVAAPTTAPMALRRPRCRCRRAPATTRRTRRS